MKITKVFKEIITGYNLANSKVDDEFSENYKTLQKDSIQYANIIEKRLIDKTFSSDIKEKYFMHPRDILIFVKKPYRVGTYPFLINDLKIVIPSNFIILRDINMDYYSYIFVANYLEKIGIKKLVEKERIDGNLTITDIIKIDLPDIPKEKQMSISELLQAINRRSAIYNNILANDEKIVIDAIEKVIGDNHD